MTALNGWENFYVIVGSAAGALIGLQFVVVTLIADKPALRMAEAGAAFATPTIVHLGSALLISAIVCIPWQTATALAVIWGICGIVGALYCFSIVRHLCLQKIYAPVLEDWLFHVVLPFAAYVTLAVSGVIAHKDLRMALYAVCGAVLLILFVGIHNAWDSVVYHVFVDRKKT